MKGVKEKEDFLIKFSSQSDTTGPIVCYRQVSVRVTRDVGN